MQCMPMLEETMKILIAYDGTVHAKTALKYGLNKAREKQGEILVLHVFDRSAFIDYDAGPKAEEMARAEAARHIEEAKKLIGEAAAGVQARISTEEGDAEEVVLQYAERGQPDLILAPPRYKALKKSSSFTVYIIPGVILVPVDNTVSPLSNIDRIQEEAAATKSKVVLLGVVPIHLYSREERKELEAVRKETGARLNAIEKALAADGIETKKVLRSGYPDEEILKAADEFSASMILIPAGGDAPSELSKAAAVILDEPERVRTPVLLLPSTGAA